MPLPTCCVEDCCHLMACTLHATGLQLIEKHLRQTYWLEAVPEMSAHHNKSARPQSAVPKGTTWLQPTDSSQRKTSDHNACQQSCCLSLDMLVSEQMLVCPGGGATGRAFDTHRDPAEGRGHSKHGKKQQEEAEKEDLRTAGSSSITQCRTSSQHSTSNGLHSRRKGLSHPSQHRPSLQIHLSQKPQLNATMTVALVPQHPHQTSRLAL